MFGLLFFKRMPRVFMLVLLFITVFLLAFLLLGCTKEDTTYSSIFLIKYKFNTNSTLYPLITTAYKNNNLTGYEAMEVRTNYLSLCVTLDDVKSCTTRTDISQFKNLTSVNIYAQNSNSSTTLDLVSLAAEFSNEVVHPYILIATVVLTIVLMLTLFYIVVPGLPGKKKINKFNLVLAPTLALLWGLGAMWAHVAANSGSTLVQLSSMDVVKAHVGRKAAAMTWTPFTFMMIVAIGVLALYLRDLHDIIEAVDPKV